MPNIRSQIVEKIASILGSYNVGNVVNVPDVVVPVYDLTNIESAKSLTIVKTAVNTASSWLQFTSPAGVPMNEYWNITYLDGAFDQADTKYVTIGFSTDGGTNWIPIFEPVAEVQTMTTDITSPYWIPPNSMLGFKTGATVGNDNFTATSFLAVRYKTI